MREKKNSRMLLVVAGLVILIAVAVGGYMLYKNHMIEKYQTIIDGNLKRIASYEGETYYTPEDQNKVKNLENSYKKDIDSRNLGSLSSDKEQSEKLYKAIGQTIKEYNKLYASLNEELERTNQLEKQYFAKDYDRSGLDATKASVTQAVDSSDYKQYKQLYQDIKSKNDALEQYLSEQVALLFNAPTNDDINAKYPFAVDTDKYEEDMQLDILVKQNKKYPTFVTTTAAETTDSKPTTEFWIDDTSDYYNYKFKNIPTKEIKVQNKKKEIQKALVNTQINFTLTDDFSYDSGTKEAKLNQRPAYLLEDKDGEFYLALKSYDGQDYYVLYNNQIGG